MAGVTLGALSIQSCTPSPEPEKNSPESTAEKWSVFELNEVSIAFLQGAMTDGTFTCRAITELYLRRIREIDLRGPSLRAVIELNPDALSIADEMDKERKGGKVRGPMHGIPILVKDNVDTGDKMMNTAGSLAMVGNIPDKDAFVIKQLRAAGAVILGKTNLSEWANFRSSRSSSGWSSRGGQTKNPIALDRNPCGSSSGSAVAVAGNLCAVAVGTETNGSIVAPAAFCGIVGMKPTVGLVSRNGIIPISFTQDTAGPMARTVADLAVLLGAMTGMDENDPVTNESSGKSVPDYSVYLDKDGLKGKRIGIERSALKTHEAMDSILKEALETMKKAGAEVVEVDLVSVLQSIGNAELTVLQYEFKDGLNKYLANARGKVRSLKELIEYNKKNSAEVMPWFGQEQLEWCEAKGGLESKEYLDARAASTGSRVTINQLMESNKLDVICAPSIGFPNCTDLVNGDYGTGFYFCSPAAMSGFPHITLPMGNFRGLPAAISFMAGAYQEGELIRIAYAFEQLTKKRTAPLFLPSIS